MKMRLNDYIDADVAYLLGLILGRGTLVDHANQRQLIIEFPSSSIQAQGINTSFDQDIYIKIGLFDIRERLIDLLDTDIKIIERASGFDFVARFQRPSMVWRNILLILNNATSYPYFRIPPVFFEPDLPFEWKREFLRGFADVAGNIRQSNNYFGGRHRARLDVLNYPTNWELPVQLCLLLQEHLDVPVQMITWGHPNLGRGFREHQLNIFAEAFQRIGFNFQHKQIILDELATYNIEHYPTASSNPCPGMRPLRNSKPLDAQENNAERLDPRLVGNHYDAYWEICKALGCPRMPADVSLVEEE